MIISSLALGSPPHKTLIEIFHNFLRDVTNGYRQKDRQTTAQTRVKI